MKAPQNNTMNPPSASANGLQRSRVIVVLGCGKRSSAGKIDGRYWLREAFSGRSTSRPRATGP
jgi:hypothetical protein